MYPRRFWTNRVLSAWERRSVVWLKGVRRVGKTVLSKNLPEVEYVDCELPRVRRDMEDPEAFLRSLEGRTVVLDEIHRLANPSQLLKIAADHFPDTRILATGSSSLSSSAHFADTLTGRKEEVWLTPMVMADLEDFGQVASQDTGSLDLGRRLVRGGLPPFFLSKDLPEREFQEWMDAYWAKDILELFRLRQRHSFLRFVELLMVRSGGMFEATSYARPCEVSRVSISNYLGVLEATLVAHVIRPFSRRRKAEIVSAPKVYAFDTGFICYFRGWHELRPDDRGILWEHFVLNELQAHLPPGAKIQYWRSKHGNEVDFVLTRRGKDPVAIECKWSADDLDLRNLRVFRNQYPGGENFVVAADVERPMTRDVSGMEVEVVGLKGLVRFLQIDPHGDLEVRDTANPGADLE